LKANAWTRLGIVYQLRGDNKLASKYFLKSTFLNIKAGSKIQASHGYNNLAIVCFGENDLEGALLNFEKALKLRLECHNWKAISESYFNIGEYYLEVKNHSKAIEHYNKSLEVASKKGLLVEKMDALDAIIKVHKSKRDFVKAFQLMEEYLKVKSVLLERDKMDLINASEMDLILQEKEQKLIQSNRESELFEKMKNQKMNMYFLIGGFSILFIVFIGFLFYKKPINKV
jgi:tetratricopeptide (TPR) repeat protein